jgi:hypothetical protein
MLARPILVCFILLLPLTASAEKTRELTVGEAAGPIIAGALPLIGLSTGFMLWAEGVKGGWGDDPWEPSRKEKLYINVGVTLIATAPTLGHLYNRRYKRALAYAGVVGLCAASIQVGFMLQHNGNETAGSVLAGAGMLGYLGTTLYSMGDSFRVAWEQKKLSITPTALRGPSGSTGAGMALGFSF